MDGIKRATDVMIAGKIAVVAGYGDVEQEFGPGPACPLEPRCGLPRSTRSARYAGRDGRPTRASSPWRYAADKADIFVTTTGNYKVITHDHMARMKNPGHRLRNIGHFDNEIDVASLEKYTWEEIKPQVDHVIFPDGKRIILLAKGRLVNLGCGTVATPRT